MYRYRLGYRVLVDDFVYRTPSVQFVGRDDKVSDLFGEKLSDGFVAGVIDQLFEGNAAAVCRACARPGADRNVLHAVRRVR